MVQAWLEVRLGKQQPVWEEPLPIQTHVNEFPPKGSGIKVLPFYAAGANLPVTNSYPYSGSRSVTSDSFENQILLGPTSTGTALLTGPASFLSRPPLF